VEPALEADHLTLPGEFQVVYSTHTPRVLGSGRDGQRVRRL